MDLMLIPGIIDKIRAERYERAIETATATIAMARIAMAKASPKGPVFAQAKHGNHNERKKETVLMILDLSGHI